MGLVPVTKRLPKEPLSDTIRSTAPACSTAALTENENPPKVSAEIKIGQQLQPFLPFKAKTSETHTAVQSVFRGFQIPIFFHSVARRLGWIVNSEQR